jgi:ABC-type multidrug transport system fused ATPase/permease subunit
VTRVRAAVTANMISMAQNLLTLLLGLTLVIVGPDTLLARANQFNLPLPVPVSGINLGPVRLLVAGALLPIVCLPIFTRTNLRELMRQELTLLSQTTAPAKEMLSNTAIIKAFTREDDEIVSYQTLAWRQFAITKSE